MMTKYQRRKIKQGIQAMDNKALENYIDSCTEDFTESQLAYVVFHLTNNYDQRLRKKYAPRKTPVQR